LFPAAVFPLIAVCAALAPYFSPFDPLEINFASILQGISRDHLLGTDELGRDVLARVLFGTQVSVIVSIGTIAVLLLFDRAVRGMHPYLFVAVCSAVILGIEAFIAWYALIPEPTPTIGSMIVRGWHAGARWMVYPPALVLVATSLFAGCMGTILQVRRASGG